MQLATIASFMKHESTAGVLVMSAAALALVIDNSALSSHYDGFLGTPVSIKVGALALDKTLLQFINDGLMAVFFMLVGLEIKRELLIGELSTREQAILPVVAAIGGMAAPAMVYALINQGDPTALRGWAIPAATDIAFALGVLAMLGSRVPASLKVFLLALAIIDDLGAIIIIALFYTAELSTTALALAAAGIAVLAALNRAGVTRIAPYIVTGVFIWVCVLKSGVHATLAGVVVGLFVPISGAEGEEDGPLHRLEDMLHPWVAYAILPIFAFANAGISLFGVTSAHFTQPITLGIMLGLIVGKPVGIMAATWAAVRLGICRMPEGSTWGQVLGVAMLAGIGFTMSLFIGMLALPDPAHAVLIRLGVLGGSIVSAVAGYALLRALSLPASALPQSATPRR